MDRREFVGVVAAVLVGGRAIWERLCRRKEYRGTVIEVRDGSEPGFKHVTVKWHNGRATPNLSFEHLKFTGYYPSPELAWKVGDTYVMTPV